MMRKMSTVVILALCCCPAAFGADGTAGPPPPPQLVAEAAKQVASWFGMLCLFGISLAGAAGVLGFSILALSIESYRSEVEALSHIANRSPRKSLAVGIVCLLAGGLVTALMLHAPPLRLFGLALLVALVAGVVKGFISRVTSAGRAIEQQCGDWARWPFRDAVLGTAAFEMVFLFPILGQIFVGLAAAQGFGAHVLMLVGRGLETPAEPLKPADEAPAV